MDKRTRITVIGFTTVILIVIIGIGMFIKDSLTPSKEVVSLTEYYQVDDSKVMLIIRDEIKELQGLYIDDTVYIDYETAKNEFNHRFYWDAKENILTYTTPSEILRAELGSLEYTITKTLNSTRVKSDYEIIKVFGDKVYLALDFIGKYSDMSYRFYPNPNRVVINYGWGNHLYTEVTKETQLRSEPNAKSSTLSQLSEGTALVYIDGNVASKNGFIKVRSSDKVEGYVHEDYVGRPFYQALFTEVTKATQLRVEPDMKQPLLTELSVGKPLLYVDRDEAPKKGFIKVMTEDGIVGYVKEKHVKKSFYKKTESDYRAPEYTAQIRQDKINLVFHQIFNSDATGSLETLIKATKKVNVVSPTWFDVVDTDGNLSSLASHEYVNKAKELGLEVWALVGDVNIKIDMEELLSKTSARDKLSNDLIQAALEYKLDGINVDFETISSNAEGIHFIQFLRELSVKCRNNGLVLSVDNYVPAPYNKHYDLKEQGIIADYIIIMAYNEFTGSEGIGPVSSIGFVKDAINNTLASVSNEKTIIAIPFYTKLWKETEDGTVTSENLAMSKAAQVFTDNNLEKEWDDTYSYHYGEYGKDGATYRIWLEDDRSIEEKMNAIYNANIAGVASWKLGLEKESIWDVIIRYLN